jgi:hypothetical protein
MANDFFAAIIDGTIKIGDPVKFPLEEAPKAHGLLESAKRIDLIVLAP